MLDREPGVLGGFPRLPPRFLACICVRFAVVVFLMSRRARRRSHGTNSMPFSLHAGITLTFPCFLGIGVAGVGLQRMISLGQEQLTSAESVCPLLGGCRADGRTHHTSAHFERSAKRHHRVPNLWAQYGLNQYRASRRGAATKLSTGRIGGWTPDCCCAKPCSGECILAPRVMKDVSGSLALNKGLPPSPTET